MTTLGESLRKVQEERESREPRMTSGYVSNDKIYVSPYDLLKDMGYVSKLVFQCTTCNEWHEDINIARECCDVKVVKERLHIARIGIVDAQDKVKAAEKTLKEACDWHKTLEMKLNKLQLQRGKLRITPEQVVSGSYEEHQAEKSKRLAEAYGMNADQVRARSDAARHAMEYVINSERGTVCPCPKCKKEWYTERDALSCCS
jgi:hypothetical protein